MRRGEERGGEGREGEGSGEKVVYLGLGLVGVRFRLGLVLGVRLGLVFWVHFGLGLTWTRYSPTVI